MTTETLPELLPRLQQDQFRREMRRQLESDSSHLADTQTMDSPAALYRAHLQQHCPRMFRILEQNALLQDASLLAQMRYERRLMDLLHQQLHLDQAREMALQEEIYPPAETEVSATMRMLDSLERDSLEQQGAAVQAILAGRSILPPNEPGPVSPI